MINTPPMSDAFRATIITIGLWLFLLMIVLCAITGSMIPFAIGHPILTTAGAFGSPDKGARRVFGVIASVQWAALVGLLIWRGGL